ncbi:Uncharacterized conserved protein, DUF1697 family [Formosa sp. Hel1_31_208]|uniref:DUF1697 domain-containing protein n=1 Tax=Formosa sp. Hel1_31_208 TaxID=1798225 RepID=UPI00087B9CD5|nr:DUF1697 domain-containing protein [Formosa sp. Hel1_31_208]SDR86973.1 Uncharacterized conserved protein, DUF1697 family [Formosa sp. Hel1_31_208]
MKTVIVLLRGINVGGHKKIPMAELRDLLALEGYQNVRTYIQSGNVVLESAEDSLTVIEDTVQKAIHSKFGFDVPVIAKTSKALQLIFDACPFSEEKKIKSYFTLLQSTPKKQDVIEATKKQYDGEEYVILNNCIYYYCEKGYGQAKFNMSLFERKLNTQATSRNYKTMLKLLAMSDENEKDH